LCGTEGATGWHHEPERDYWRCERCALVFLTPGQRLALAAEVDRYRLHRNSVDEPGYLTFLARLTEPMLARVPEGAHGLDYGSGPAPALALLMSRSGRPTVSYDPVFQPDANVLAARYDFVTCCEVLEHAFEPTALLGTLARLVTPGGTIGVMTRWYDQHTAFASWHYRRDPTHVCFYSVQTMQWIADHFGWQLALPATDVAIYTVGAPRVAR
jgi:hypothetical protein